MQSDNIDRMDQSQKKIRTLIVDDEPVARRGIRHRLRNAPDIEVIGEAGNGREAVIFIKEQKPDLVFLDVQMPVLDGFGVVEKVGVKDMPATVFVTAFDEHAIRAFEVNALDYLLKPIEPQRFQVTLERVRGDLKNTKADALERKLSMLLENYPSPETSSQQPAFLERVVIREQGRITFLSVREIAWLSSEGNYVKLHAIGEKTHLLRETMDSIERRLNPKEFIRLRRAAIVRIEEIKEMSLLFKGEYAITLKSGAKLSSSRHYRKNLEGLLKS